MGVCGAWWFPEMTATARINMNMGPLTSSEVQRNGGHKPLSKGSSYPIWHENFFCMLGVVGLLFVPCIVVARCSCPLRREAAD